MRTRTGDDATRQKLPKRSSASTKAPRGDGLLAIVSGACEALGSLPKFVVREVEEYLRCEMLEHGYVRVKCRRVASNDSLD